MVMGAEGRVGGMVARQWAVELHGVREELPNRAQVGEGQRAQRRIGGRPRNGHANSVSLVHPKESSGVGLPDDERVESRAQLAGDASLGKEHEGGGAWAEHSDLLGCPLDGARAVQSLTAAYGKGGRLQWLRGEFTEGGKGAPCGWSCAAQRL